MQIQIPRKGIPNLSHFRSQHPLVLVDDAKTTIFMVHLLNLHFSSVRMVQGEVAGRL